MLSTLKKSVWKRKLVWNSPAPPLSRWEVVLLGIILAYGVALRSWNLGSTPLWVDEAETSINALTILQHGVPTDHYLGLPIFENTFTQSWPESEEYEFRDTSYSERGMATYHGWFPLYAIAASFAVAGVQPDDALDEMSVRHLPSEMYRRALAARVPAVLFGFIFMLAVFFAGRELYGCDAGWAALIAASISTSCINFGSNARYYSPTLALSALCCLLFYLLLRKGRWCDFLVSSVLIVLLFHTHIVSFIAICVAVVLIVPFLIIHSRIALKLALFTGVVALGTIPWALYTGFIGSQVSLPRARSLLSLAQVINYPMNRLPLVLALFCLFAWLLAVRLFPKRMPQRLILPFKNSRWAFFFLAAWSLSGFLIFVWFAPAASYFYSRITLVLLAPALLLGAMFFAAIARVFYPRCSTVLAPALMGMFLTFTGMASFRIDSMSLSDSPICKVINYLREQNIRPGTRFYADAGNNLILRFYTGLPVQNIMPVRKSFIENYPGEILILEAPRYNCLGWRKFQQYVVNTRRDFTSVEARTLLRSHSYPLLRKNLQTRVFRIFPEAETTPDFLYPVIQALLVETSEKVTEDAQNTGNPMFKGYEIPDYTTMWQVFFYRFVDPEARMGAHLNYANRIRNATAYILPEEYVLIHSPALNAP